jgi:hypothetical protein
MDIPLDGTLSNNFNYMYYIKSIENDDSLCAICMMNESDKKKWSKYELKCGHKMHSRCFRTWVNEKEKVVCPYCGDMEKRDNYYCILCNKFGHSGFMINGKYECPRF